MRRALTHPPRRARVRRARAAVVATALTAGVAALALVVGGGTVGSGSVTGSAGSSSTLADATTGTLSVDPAADLAVTPQQPVQPVQPVQQPGPVDVPPLDPEAEHEHDHPEDEHGHAATPADTAADAATAPAAPAAPAAPIEVSGTLTRAYVEADAPDASHDADHPDHADHAEDGSAQLTSIQPDDGPAVPVPSSQLAQVPTDAVVRVSLDAVPVASADDASEAGHPVLSADVVALPPAEDAAAETGGDEGVAAAATVVEHSVRVVQVRPAGAPAGTVSLQAVMDMVDGPVSGFWSEQTNERVQFTVNRSRSKGWYTSTHSCSDYTALVDEAAGSVGFDMRGRTNDHLLIYLPKGAPGCSAGLAQVTSAANGNGWAYVTGPNSGGTDVSLIAHELGHNLGLGHSDALQCDGVGDGTYVSKTSYGTACSVRGYGDWYDVMGISWQHLGSLNAVHAAYLGAISGSAVVTATSSVQATLRPMADRTGTRAIRVVDGPTVYWVEFRPARGRDGYLTPSGNYQGLESGVLVRRAQVDANASVLLDGTPGPRSSWGSDWQTTLRPGGRIVLASGRIAIRTDAVSTSSATVSVVFGRSTPRPVPAAAPTGSTGTAKPGVLTPSRLRPAASQYTTYEVKSQATGGVVLRRSFAAGAQPGAVAGDVAGLVADLEPGDYVVSSWVSDTDGGAPAATTTDVQQQELVIDG